MLLLHHSQEALQYCLNFYTAESPFLHTDSSLFPILFCGFDFTFTIEQNHEKYISITQKVLHYN